jgi:hypothetical protein
MKDQGHRVLLRLHSRGNEISITHKITIIDAKATTFSEQRRRHADRSHQMIVLSSGMTDDEQICNRKKRTLMVEQECMFSLLDTKDKRE